MLIPRLITALILIPITLLILYYLPPLPFLILTSILTLYGAWEWSRLMQIQRRSRKIIYLLIIALICTASMMVPANILLKLAGIWWVFAFVLVASYPRLSSIWNKSHLVQGLMGACVLVPFWWSLNYIRGAASKEQFCTLLFLLVLIWGADSGAYFAGRKFGKHKLAPRVSPGKSWEGCIGAFVTTIIIALIAFKLANLPVNRWLRGILLSIITIVFSIVGDLFESMFKRNAGMKDSGNLLPGHGGLLDRIDSLTAATPIFALSVLILLNK